MKRHWCYAADSRQSAFILDGVEGEWLVGGCSLFIQFRVPGTASQAWMASQIPNISRVFRGSSGCHPIIVYWWVMNPRKLYGGVMNCKGPRAKCWNA